MLILIRIENAEFFDNRPPLKNHSMDFYSQLEFLLSQLDTPDGASNRTLPLHRTTKEVKMDNILLKYVTEMT